MKGVPSIVQALLLLVLAFVAAFLAKWVVKKAVKGLFGKRVQEGSAEVKAGFDKTVNIVGSLIFAIVFILFLPGALDKLGLGSVTAPISSMASQFLNFLPKLIAAIILVAFGIFLAKLVAQLASAGLAKVGVNKIQEKFKVEAKPGNQISDVIGKFLYVIIAMIFVIAGIRVLGIAGISDPAMGMVDTIFAFIPKAFAAAVVILFGVFLGKTIGGLVETVLGGSGVDKFSKATYQANNPKAAPASKIIGIVVTAVIDIIFVVAGVNILGIEVLTHVGTAVIAYLPSLLVACLIVLVAWAVGSWVQKLIVSTYPNAKGMAIAAKVVILVLAGFMALGQLGISASIINTLFMWMCIGGAAAFALAFGLGGKDWAKKQLDKLSKDTEDQLKK